MVIVQRSIERESSKHHLAVRLFAKYRDKQRDHVTDIHKGGRLQIQ